MSYAGNRKGDKFFASTGNFTWKHLMKLCLFSNMFNNCLCFTAVFMAEVTKLTLCLIIVCIEEGNFHKFLNALHTTIIKNPKDTLKVCVPSLVYIIQNNLLYVSTANLDAATYQVTLIIFLI